MRITTEQLQQHLARGLKALYAVFGAETLLALEASDRIRAAARAAGHTEREVLIAESGFKWSDLAFAADSQSLFASRRILEIRIPNGKPGVEGGAALQALCERLPQDTLTLVQLPELDWRTQQSGWVEALDRAGVVVEARAVARSALPQWLAGRLKAQKQEADKETLEFIADRVEGNLMAAYQEVQKLALIAPEGKLPFDAVRDAVLDVARYDVFESGVVMLEGDPLRITRTLEGLKGEGVAAPLLLWVLSEDIRAFGRIVDGAAQGRNPAQLVRDMRVRGATRQNLMANAARRFTPSHIANALRHAAAIDRIVKGLDKGDIWDELLQLALRFSKAAVALSS